MRVHIHISLPFISTILDIICLVHGVMYLLLSSTTLSHHMNYRLWSLGIRYYLPLLNSGTICWYIWYLPTSAIIYDSLLVLRFSAIIWSALTARIGYRLHFSLSTRYHLSLSIAICWYVLLALGLCYHCPLSAIVTVKTKMPHTKRTKTTQKPFQENAEMPKWRVSHLSIKLLTGNLRANLRATTQNKIHFRGSEEAESCNSNLQYVSDTSYLPMRAGSWRRKKERKNKRKKEKKNQRRKKGRKEERKKGRTEERNNSYTFRCLSGFC